MSQQKETGGNKHEVYQNDSDSEEPSDDEEMEGIGKSGKEWGELEGVGLRSSFGATSFTIQSHKITLSISWWIYWLMIV